MMTNEEAIKSAYSKAIKSAYSKLMLCLLNEEVGNKTLMSPKGKEITVLILTLQDYAQKNGVNVYD